MKDKITPIPSEQNQFFLKVVDTPGKEKIIVGIGKEGYHVTLHFGTKSGYLDIHKKKETTGEYEDLFKMKHYSMLRLFAYCKHTFIWALHKYWSKTINIGKLKRHECFLVSINPPEEKENVFVRIRKNGKHMKLQDSIPLKELENMVIEPDDIFKDGGKIYQVYSTKGNTWRYKGLVFQNMINPDSRRLHWVSKKDFAAFQKVTAIGMYNALSRVEFGNKKKILKLLREGIEQRYNLKFRAAC